MKSSKYLRAMYYQLKNIKKYDYVPNNNGIIVSLTSVPSRINQIKPVIISLLSQTIKPDCIELNLGKYPLKLDIPWTVPEWLLKLNSVKIFWLDQDYGPASKFIPTLIRHQNDNLLIVVVDDDMVYNKKLIETFFLADKQFLQEAVFCSNGFTLPHEKISADNINDKAVKKGLRRVGVIEGAGGYCIRPKHFDLSALMDFNSAPENACKIDDLWISGHLSRRQVKKYQLPMGKRKSLPQVLKPAIVVERDSISYQLIQYFAQDWSQEEYQIKK